MNYFFFLPNTLSFPAYTSHWLILWKIFYTPAIQIYSNPAKVSCYNMMSSASLGTILHKSLTFLHFLGGEVLTAFVLDVNYYKGQCSGKSQICKNAFLEESVKFSLKRKCLSRNLKDEFCQELWSVEILPYYQTNKLSCKRFTEADKSMKIFNQTERSLLLTVFITARLLALSYPSSQILVTTGDTTKAR